MSPAAAMVKERVARLRRLAVRKGDAFRRRFVGRVLQVVTLQELRPDGRLRALGARIERTDP